MGEGRNLVGVDIGSSSVKVAQIKLGRKGPTLVRFGYAPLAPQTIVDGQVMDASAVVAALQKVFQETRITQREVALSVSGQSVIIRKITVPLMTQAELDEQITWEAEQHIPFDIKDVQVDYQVLRRRPEASQMDLLLVAAKRDQIQDYAQLARDAKLKPITCDIDAFSVQNLFEFSRGLPQDETIALINVGATLSSLNIIAGGVSAFTREIANGGNVITEEIQKSLSIPFEQAEAYKCGGSNDPAFAGIVPKQVVQVIDQVTDSIAAEIQRSLDFYLATSGEEEIKRIYVTGGTANLAALSQAIERRARIPVEPWSPLERLLVDPKTVDQALLAQRAAQLPVALGLALRKEREAREAPSGPKLVRVNLLPQKRRSERQEATQLWLLATVAVLLIEVVSLFVFHGFKQEELKKAQVENQVVREKIDAAKRTVSNHGEVTRQLEELRARETAIAKLQTGRTGPTAVLLELARLLTPGRGPRIDPDRYNEIKATNPLAVHNPNWDARRLWLESFVENARRVKLVGIARDGEDVSELARRLSLSAYFKDVRLLPGHKKTEAGIELVNFELETVTVY